MAEFVYPTLAKDENIIDDYHGTKVGTKVICIIIIKAVQCLLILYIFEEVHLNRLKLRNAFVFFLVKLLKDDTSYIKICKQSL